MPGGWATTLNNIGNMTSLFRARLARKRGERDALTESATDDGSALQLCQNGGADESTRQARRRRLEQMDLVARAAATESEVTIAVDRRRRRMAANVVAQTMRCAITVKVESEVEGAAENSMADAAVQQRRLARQRRREELERAEVCLVSDSDSDEEANSDPLIDCATTTEPVLEQQRLEVATSQRVVERDDEWIMQAVPRRPVKRRPSTRISAAKKAAQELPNFVDMDSEPEMDLGEARAYDSDLDSENEEIARSCVKDGRKRRTSNQYRSNRLSWASACAVHQMSCWRTHVLDSPAEVQKEALKMARVVITVYTQMLPKRREDAAPKPKSAFAVYHNVGKMHKHPLVGLGASWVGSDAVRDAMKGLVFRYITKWGYRPLMVRRKEPFKLKMIRAMVTLPQGTKVGPWVVDSTALSTYSRNALVECEAQTGFRKAEVSVDNAKVGFTKEQLSRASLTWHINGVDYSEPTPELLEGMREGSYAMIQPNPSKCDFDGSFWCDKLIYLAYHPHAPVNAARGLSLLERAFPLYGPERAEKPLFADDGYKPFTRHRLDAFLADALRIYFRQTGQSEDLVEQYSWHSFRIYLATALSEQHVPNDTIKRILRWISDEVCV